MIRTGRMAVLPTVLCLAACGGEGSLSLRLLRAEFDRPFDGVTRLELRVLDAEFEERERLDAEASGDSVRLGVIPSGTVRLEVVGLGGGKALSRGQSRLLQLEAGESAREVVPFATPTVAVALPASHGIAPAVTVDGDLAEWQGSPSLVLDSSHLVAGTVGSGQDPRAELYLAWSGSELAFALRVEDDCPSLRPGLPAGTCGTAGAAERICLGFDGDDDGTGYGAGDLWVELTATGVEVRRGTVTPEQLAVVMAPRRDLRGWFVEGTVAVAALGRAALGVQDRIGFDLVLIDEDPGKAAPTALRWSGGSAAATEPTPPGSMGTIGLGQL